MTTSKNLKGYTLGGSVVDRNLSLNESINCPFCHKAIETNPLSFLERKSNTRAEFFLRCKVCHKSFVGYSKYSPKTNSYHIYKLSKGNRKARIFPEEIKETSEKFVQIYCEAEIAEQENLTEICGVGYRKALEFLIKDYLIKKFPGKEEEIKEKSLGDCIRDMIDNQKIKDISQRATWLGNDETHYFRKWEDKDLSDLKKLIDITVYFISMDVEADKYMEDMEG